MSHQRWTKSTKKRINETAIGGYTKQTHGKGCQKTYVRHAKRHKNLHPCTDSLTHTVTGAKEKNLFPQTYFFTFHPCHVFYSFRWHSQSIRKWLRLLLSCAIVFRVLKRQFSKKSVKCLTFGACFVACQAKLLLLDPFFHFHSAAFVETKMTAPQKLELRRCCRRRRRRVKKFQLPNNFSTPKSRRAVFAWLLCRCTRNLYGVTVDNRQTQNKMYCGINRNMETVIVKHQQCTTFYYYSMFEGFIFISTINSA